MSSIVLIVFYLWHHPYYICNHSYDSIVLCYVYKLDCNVVVVQFIITFVLSHCTCLRFSYLSAC